MKILVPIKSVIDRSLNATSSFQFYSFIGGIDQTGHKFTVNPFDLVAIEAAIQLKENKKANELIGLSIGSSKALECLRTALAMGLNSAIHIETSLRIDHIISPIIVAKIISQIAQKEKIDLIMLGKQAIDDDFGQTALLLGGILKWPAIVNIEEIKIHGRNIEVQRTFDEGIQFIKFQRPGIVSCDLRLNQPRIPNLMKLIKAQKKQITKLKLEECIESKFLEQIGFGIKEFKLLDAQKKVKMFNSEEEFINKFVSEIKDFIK